MRHLTCDPNAMAIGQTMLAYLDNLAGENIKPILEKHNLTTIKPDEWYPLQPFLDVLNDLSNQSDMSSNYVAIGMATVENMIIPPEVESLTLAQVLEGWDDLYQIQHRGGDVGKVIVEKVTDTHYQTHLQHVYPDDMTYGVAYGLARRWLPKGTPFTVKYDETVKRRDLGGEDTILHIIW